MTLTDLLTWPLFAIADQPVTVVEAIGFVTGALCVLAVARQSIWNWPLGLVNNAAFFALFLGVGLYADATLQVVFAALSVYGWINWHRRRVGGIRLPIRRAGRVEVVLGLVAAVVATVAVALLLAAETDSAVPWPDAFVLAFSLLATWGQARKLIEQWWVWIAVDVVSVPLYLVKGLWLTALLYTGFLALCVWGLRGWTRELRAQRAAYAGHGMDAPSDPVDVEAGTEHTRAAAVRA
ncbi:nicotinamide riboside transporter PnuC [Agromyces sp. MMS24-K17]|uniref:nicotinamide riboside transporter PnuC n=1 Tax=Agromyces sp. MMS24-K17 TaxID=3372850 RepID=UPI003754A34B